MPPRIPLFPCLRTQNSKSETSEDEEFQLTCPGALTHSTFILPIRSFTATTSFQKKKVLTRAQQRRKQDKYRMTQYKAQIAANVSRQKALKEERKIAAGDPVRGTTTAFVQSFDIAQDQSHATANAALNRAYTALRYGPSETQPAGAADSTAREPYLANTLNLKTIAHRLRHSFTQTQPSPLLPSALRSAYPPTQDPNLDPALAAKAEEEQRLKHDAQRTARHAQQHDNAAVAIARITALSNASARGRRKVNIARCVAEFGRHSTDAVLEPKPLGLPAMGREEKDPEGWVAARTAEAQAQREHEGMKQRGGPDTGSSEVQIAILTAKIRAVAAGQEWTKRDKAGQRALRLLVHRRQKLLKYLWRKERGGPRFQHCIEKLGLTEGTWKGEITV